MDFLLSLLLIPFALPLALGFVSMCCCSTQATVECTHCNGDLGPEEFIVELSGFGGSGDCCAEVDGTYTAAFTGIQLGSCRWFYGATFAGCAKDWTITILISGSTLTLTVNVEPGFGSSDFTSQFTYSDFVNGLNCTTFSNQALTQGTHTPGDSDCADTPRTVTITAV
jgi:hypothetical protein